MKNLLIPWPRALLLATVTLLAAWPREAAAKPEKVAYLGLRVSPVDPTLREQLQLPRGVGLKVMEVTPDSPAEKAVLKPHDVLERVNDQLLFNGEQLLGLMGTFKPGDKVKITLRRHGESQTVEVSLGETERDLEAAGTEDLRMRQLLRRPDTFTLNPNAFNVPSLKGLFRGLNANVPAGGFLGVEVQPVDESLQDQLGLEPDTGVLVGHVVEKSPAAKSGLESHDVILKVDGKVVAGPDDFVKLIRKHKKGDKLTLGILRNGKARDVEVTLAQQEPPQDRLIETLRHIRVDPLNRSMIRIHSGDGTVNITSDDAQRHIVVKGPDGQTLYEGPLNNAADRAKLPRRLLQRVEEAERQAAQAPEPEEDPTKLEIVPEDADPTPL